MRIENKEVKLVCLIKRRQWKSVGRWTKKWTTSNKPSFRISGNKDDTVNSNKMRNFEFHPSGA